ncbi:MAG TPA: alpha/beta hydrolase [Acidimicrobiales bacterium]|nr:alpha/beta hydrolase [Acidimicrobiales bacterium]
MPSLDRDGVTIHYDVRGETGPVVLLTHGFSSGGEAFAANADAMARAGHRVITWDLRGHGATEAGPDLRAYTVPLTLDDMLGLLDVVGADRAVLGGHSLGGYLSLSFRIHHPDRVRALVLVDTGPGYRDDEARAGWNRFVDKGAADLAAVHGEAAAQRMMLTAEGILKQHDASVIESLPLIDVPTLVIVGEKDTPFRGGSAYMASKIPGAELVVVDGAGHSPFASHPEVFDAAVAKFLAGLVGT